MKSGHEDLSPTASQPTFETNKSWVFASPKDFAEIWQTLLQEGHLEQILKSVESLLQESRVAHYKSALERSQTEDYQLGEEGASIPDVITSLQQYMQKAVNTQSPYFLNQLYGGAHPLAVLAEFVTAFMNTSMATYEIAPVATMMENEILKALAALTDWPEIDGLFVPGGSYANMMAFHVARYHKCPQVKSQGQDSKLCVYVSDQAHYSIQKAAHLLGFGENAVRIIASDSKYKMSPVYLEKQILQDLSQGLRPCAVVSTLGTTVFGALDPVKDIQAVCKKYGVWHHVDAAWGGPLIFTSKDLQKDLQDVDSITYDFHKLFGAGVTKALFVTPHAEILEQTNSCMGTEYIFHEEPDSEWDTGVKALQCGRKVEALTLWTLWKYLGQQGFKDYIDRFLRLQNFAITELRQRGFELLHEPEYLNLCFKVPVAKNSSQMLSDSQHTRLRQSLIHGGELFVNYSSDSKNGVFIRLVLSHLQINELTLQKTFDLIEQARTQC